MDKMAALVKTAEVNGVLAALIDTGHVKLATDEDFDVVADAIAANLSDNYDLEEVLNKTAEIMDEVEEIYAEEIYADEIGDQGYGEEGAEMTDRDAMAELGQAVLAKEAGEIDDEEFAKIAASVKGMFEGARTVGRKAKGFVGKGLRGEGIKDSATDLYRSSKNILKLRGNKGAQRASIRKAKSSGKNLAKSLGRSGAVFTTTAAGSGGLGYGIEKLRDRYKS